MTVSPTLKSYLSKNEVEYTLVPHPYTGSSMETAQAAHVPGDVLAKAVVMKTEDDHVMVVIRSNQYVDVADSKRRFGDGFELAPEAEFTITLTDCAVPPLGAA